MEIAPTPATSAAWVLIAGGFHQEGGMDRLNAALARYLAAHGTSVHLVGHRIDEEFASESAFHREVIRKTAGSFFLALPRLDRAGRAAAVRVSTVDPRARVVANGINCAWPDINWVHFVNHAWPPRADSGPLWLRAKSRMEARLMLRREKRILPRARMLVANSNRTRHDLIERLGLPAERVVTVYPGLDSGWRPVTNAERATARASLGIADTRPVVVFVGALGHDPRKGFDTLWAAWQRLCARDDWTATLLVAGGGRAVDVWRQTVERSQLGARVIFFGFTKLIAELLAAADLLVSPARYEPYGLNVHEAICRGVPAIVTASSGVAERYPTALADMLLPDPENADDLAERMLAWSTNIMVVTERFEPFRRVLASWSADAMARRIVELAECRDQAGNKTA
jgi:glycosyltransferase involved in cell wall biosynthesis